MGANNTNIQRANFQAIGNEVLKTQEWVKFLKELNLLLNGMSVPLASGVAKLSGGLATVYTAFANSNNRFTLTPQDTNTLGTPRVDQIKNGISFVINSTGATDVGVIYWQIFSQ